MGIQGYSTQQIAEADIAVGDQADQVAATTTVAAAQAGQAEVLAVPEARADQAEAQVVPVARAVLAALGDQAAVLAQAVPVADQADQAVAAETTPLGHAHALPTALAAAATAIFAAHTAAAQSTAHAVAADRS